MGPIRCCMLLLLLCLWSTTPALAIGFSVLWYDTTPTWGGQAPDDARKVMSDSLGNLGDSLFTSTYISATAPGQLADLLHANDFDILIVDSTSRSLMYNSDDLDAVRAFYNEKKRNLLLDGSLYTRSIVFDEFTEYTEDGPTAKLTLNQVYELARRGGGIMIGTDHDCCNYEANVVLDALLPGASFAGVFAPRKSGWLSPLLREESLAALDVNGLLEHWAAEGTKGIAPRGTFTTFDGVAVELYRQVSLYRLENGRLEDLVTASFPSTTAIVPEPATGLVAGAAAILVFTWRRKRR